MYNIGDIVNVTRHTQSLFENHDRTILDDTQCCLSQIIHLLKSELQIQCGMVMVFLGDNSRSKKQC